MKKVIVIVLITLITSFFWKDVLVFGVFKIQQDYLSNNVCVNRDKPMTQCNANCVLTERLAQPLNSLPEHNSTPLLVEIKMEFVVNDADEVLVVSSNERNPKPFLLTHELVGYLPILVKPPETV